MKQTTTEMGFVMTSSDCVGIEKYDACGIAMDPVPSTSADAVSLPAGTCDCARSNHSSTNAVFVGEMERVA